MYDLRRNELVEHKENKRLDIMNWNKIEVEEFEEKQSEVVKFDEAGQEVAGIFRGIVEFSNDNGEGHFYKLEDIDDPDLEYIVFGGLVVLDDRMKKVPLDKPVKIVYLGKKESAKNKSRSFKNFDVFIGA